MTMIHLFYKFNILAQVQLKFSFVLQNYQYTVECRNPDVRTLESAEILTPRSSDFRQIGWVIAV